MGEISPSIRLDQLPLGFRFRPTDEELINHYLKRKIDGRIRVSEAAVIPVIDVCKIEPWDLPGMSAIRSDDPQWFFFAPVDRKYPSGNRSNRATGAGYWKATGKDRQIRSRPHGGAPVLVGRKKTLVFHRGRAPKGIRTNWIMHEYRTVEPEFESGNQGCFVLCRLFKKPEETLSGLISHEPEKDGLSPTPSTSSPGSTFRRVEGLEEEFATPLNQASPQSDLHEGLHPLPETICKPSADNRLADGAHCLTYPVKPEESHSNSNMTSDAGDHEAEAAGQEEASLFDGLSDFLGPGYGHLLSDEYPDLQMLSGADYAHSFHVDQGSRERVQGPVFNQDSITEALDAMLSNPEECSAEGSNYQTNSATKVVFQSETSPINRGPDGNSVMDEDVCCAGDIEATMARQNLDLEASALPRGQAELLQFKTLQTDTFINRHNDVSRFVRKNVGFELLALDTGVHHTDSDDDSTRPASSVGASISIRNRRRLCRSMNDSANFRGQQGMAERRIRLQGSPQAEGGYFNMKQSVSTETSDDDERGNNQSNENAGVSAPRVIGLQGSQGVGYICMLQSVRFVSAGTSEDDGHGNDQNVEETEDSVPAVVRDDELFTSDDDDTSSSEFGYYLSSGEHQLSSGEHDEPTLRLRTRWTDEDTDTKLERSPLRQQVHRTGWVSARRICVAALVIVSLCAGTVWFLNSHA